LKGSENGRRKVGKRRLGWLENAQNDKWELEVNPLSPRFYSSLPTLRTKVFLVACKAAFENKRLLYNEPDKLK
jgi:hypothetical protein